VAVDVTPPMPDDLDEGDSTMTDPTHSPRPQTLAAVRRSSLAAIGQRQLADGRTVPPQRAFKGGGEGDPR